MHYNCDMTDKFQIVNFHHITFWVGNAKQAAIFYCTRMGFEPIAYKGLETGSKSVVAHVIKQGNIIFVFKSALTSGNKEIGDHLIQHGDGVRDIALTVNNCGALIENIKENEGKVLKDTWEESDENGTVRFAKVAPYGDTTHLLVENLTYKGIFLPGYKAPIESTGPIVAKLPQVNLEYIDHIVSNHTLMEQAVEWYEKNCKFHKFWYHQLSTDISGFRSTVLTNHSETLKIALNESVPGKGKSQIEEYVEYYGGDGIQHIALSTSDIITTVERLKERGTEFPYVPASYYDNLKERIRHLKINLYENLEKLEELNILVDGQEDGYLLQIFTKPLQDRPSLFMEIIQRRGHSGFGEGNFKTLFEAVERQQQARGNLFKNVIHK
ncbi:4-hydroxyphenylpyruvate dioxygenase-like [Saccoglossus kowalevskii]